MFHKPNGPGDYYLQFYRTVMVCYAILFILWTAVVIKTYYRSKMTFVYAISSIFLFSFFLEIVIAILANWIEFG